MFADGVSIFALNSPVLPHEISNACAGLKAEPGVAAIAIEGHAVVSNRPEFISVVQQSASGDAVRRPPAVYGNLHVNGEIEIVELELRIAIDVVELVAWSKRCKAAAHHQSREQLLVFSGDHTVTN